MKSTTQKPITHAKKALEYVEKALLVARQRASSFPEAHKTYYSLITEIEYVKSILIDPSIDRSGLHKIKLGGGGPAKEILEREEPELFEALTNVNYIAVRIGRGLKIDLQALEEPL